MLLPEVLQRTRGLSLQAELNFGLILGKKMKGPVLIPTGSQTSRLIPGEQESNDSANAECIQEVVIHWPK